MSPALFRIANLHIHLGPVAAASLRVASRLANRLKAGTAVAPDKLTAELILVSGPESGFPELLDLAINAGIEWRGRTAIFLDFRCDASDLAPLRKLGASVGTLDSLDSFPEAHFAADADNDARRRLQRFATATKSHIFYVTPGRKQFFAAGTAFTGTLFTPLVAATVDCLRRAGLSQADALSIAERNTLQTLRSWLKAGRKGWSGMLPEGDLEAVRRQLAALQAENELLSTYFANTAQLALLLFGEDTEWLNALSQPASPIMETMDDLQSRRLAVTGRLAANLAHDWNNLLTLLAAQANEISLALPPDHPARGLTAELNNSLAHASDSPRRLLRWLREEPGVLKQTDLNEAIRASLPLIRLALGKGIGCNLDLVRNLPSIQLDEPLLRNALLNLAMNAAQAMNGRGTFTISTAPGIRLTVADTGRGMDEETRARVFEPFYSTRQASGGSGLGLETVKAFAQSHNAAVEIDTAPGRGCRFIFELQGRAR